MGLQIEFMIHRLTRPGRKALTRSGAVAVVVSSGDARLGRRTVGAMRKGESAVQKTCTIEQVNIVNR